MSLVINGVTIDNIYANGSPVIDAYANSILVYEKMINPVWSGSSLTTKNDFGFVTSGATIRAAYKSNYGGYLTIGTGGAFPTGSSIAVYSVLQNEIQLTNTKTLKSIIVENSTTYTASTAILWSATSYNFSGSSRSVIDSHYYGFETSGGLIRSIYEDEYGGFVSLILTA